MLAQELRLSCGAACARELLRRAGIVHSEAEVREAVFYAEVGIRKLDGIFPKELGEGLSGLAGGSWVGGSLSQPEGRTRALIEEWSPLLVMLDAHWVIVEGTTKGEVEILDPEPYEGTLYATEAKLTMAHFEERFAAGNCSVVMRRK